MGRRRSMILFNCLAALGCIMMAIKDVTMINVGRFLFGFSCGVFACAVPKMIEETVPNHLLGQFGIVTNLSITFGQMISIFAGVGLTSPTLSNSNYYWRFVFLFPLVL